MTNLEPLTDAILRIMETQAEQETIRVALQVFLAIAQPKALAEVLQ